MADYGQILQAEPTDFSDRLRCGCERAGLQRGAAETHAAEVRGALLAQGRHTPSMAGCTDSQAPGRRHHRGGISAPIPERRKKRGFLNGAEQ